MVVAELSERPLVSGRLYQRQYALHERIEHSGRVPHVKIDWIEQVP